MPEIVRILVRRRLDAILVCDPANLRALTGLATDNAVLVVTRTAGTVFTDFRYVPMAHRVAPFLKVRDIRRLAFAGARIGYEGTLSHARFLKYAKLANKAKFVDVAADLAALRTVKTADEIVRLRASEALVCAIWNDARARFAAGMTEREMARIIRTLMAERGDGEAFDTIVCVGANAAECHHEPDGTVWDGCAPVLVDIGVKLDGYCSDLTRNLVPKRPSLAYRRAYDLVLKANRAAIAAVRPGLTCGALDRVARKIIADGGFGKCFGHSLGHGVGLEVHERPTARKGEKEVLKPGMLVTIEPGVYLEGNLGVRIEDLVLVTETGCEVLSESAPK